MTRWSLAAALLFIACRGTGTRADVALASRLDEAIDSALQDRRLVGAVVLVSIDGQLVYHRAAGLSDREQHRAMRETDLFRLASVTKPVVTLAALRLIDRGTMSFDDDVTRWLPDFRPRLADGTTPRITVRQLITHTSGLGYTFFEPADGPYHRAHVSDGLDQPGLSFDENARRLTSVPLLEAPGAAFIYSLSLDVLGAVVERASGQPLQQAVESLVAAQLGANDFGFTVAESERLVTPYRDARPEPTRMGEPETVSAEGIGAVVFSPGRAHDARSYPSGGGGLVGSANDVLKVLEVYRTTEAGRAMTDQLVGAQHVSSGKGMGFGYGGAVVLDAAASGHACPAGSFTWGGVYGHNWLIEPGAKLTVVALTNTAFEGMSGQFAKDVERAVCPR